jgi:hypothetical protein
MATFHAEGKTKFIGRSDKFGISHVIEKCLCAMFGFHPRMVHVPKDDAYDANNNVIRSIYQVPVIVDLGLEWRVNVERFKIIAENLSGSSHNTILMLKIITFVANVVQHLMEIK